MRKRFVLFSVAAIASALTGCAPQNRDYLGRANSLGTESLEHCARFDRPALPTRSSIASSRQRSDCLPE